MGDRGSLNAARWNGSGPWSEAWFLTCADPRRGIALWLRYALEVDRNGAAVPSVWGSFMDRSRAFALRNVYPAAAFGRTDPVAIGSAELSESGSNTGLAEMELRLRVRAFPGAPWRPHATLTSTAASLELCGEGIEQNLANRLITQAIGSSGQAPPAAGQPSGPTRVAPGA